MRRPTELRSKRRMHYGNHAPSQARPLCSFAVQIYFLKMLLPLASNSCTFVDRIGASSYHKKNEQVFFFISL